MRKKLFLACIVLFIFSGSSLGVSVNAASMWSQTYGGADTAEAVYSIIATPDGGYALAGEIRPALSLDYQFWLIKTDAFGTMEWNKTYSGGRARAVVATADGGYAIAGSSSLVKTDAAGNMQWNKTYNVGASSVESLIATPDGGYAVAAGLTSAGKAFLVKTDALGNVEWNQTYTLRTGWFPGKWTVVATTDSGYAVAGTTSSDFLLIKTDALGNMQWNKTYGGTTNNMATSLIATTDGGYAIAGVFNASDYSRSGGTEADFYLVKTDAAGNLQWNKTYPRAKNDYAWSVIAATDGGYAIAGNAYAAPDGNSTDFWLVKTDSFGNELWNRTYGGTDSDIATSLIATVDGGYAVAGGTSSFGPGNAWLVKTDYFGFVPEYSSWLIPALVLTATAFILINKKRLLRKHPQV